MMWLILWSIVLACLSGCAAIGPNYRPPAIEAPPHYARSQEKATDVPALEKLAWWELFNDPTLTGLVREGVAGNLDVKIAKERVLQARALVTATRADLWPSVSLGGAVSRSRASENVMGQGGTTTLYNAGLDASWEIDVFGGTRRKIESAEASAQAQVEGLNDVLLTLLGDIALNYIELRSAQEQLAITRQNVEVQTNSVQVTSKRYRIGLTTYLDVARAEAQKSATESDIPSIEASIQASINRLSVLLDKEPNALSSELASSRPLPGWSGLMATGLPSELLTRRPDLRGAERNLAAASAEIGVAVSDLYPKFDLTLGMGLEASSLSKIASLSSGYWSAVPQVSMLLFDAGKTQATIEGREAVYREAFLEFRSTFLKALEDVENNLTDYYSQQTRLKTLQETVAADEVACSLSLERYRRGLSNFLDVLDSQRALYAAQSALRKAEANVLKSLVALYKSLGGGWNAFEVNERI
jgi:outer membrane protein, multidrug efflux system